MSPQQTIHLIQDISLFGLVLALWLVVVLVMMTRRAKQEKTIRERIEQLQNKNVIDRKLKLWHEEGEATTVVPAINRRRTFASRMESLRQVTGWRTPTQSLVLYFIGLSILIFLVVHLLTARPILGLAGVLVMWFIIWLYVRNAYATHDKKFERQLVDALSLAARSLRSGHPLTGAFQLVAEEMEPPISDIFSSICQQQALGVNLEMAIAEAAELSNNNDMRMFATATVIQMRSGGNLADMMERLRDVIRDRIRLSRRAKVLTAQTRLSKRILVAMPFVIFLVLQVLNPEYLSPLYTTPGGRMALILAGCMLICGVWIMNRIAELKY